MSVVNCKVKYIRPKYNNLKEWMNDPNNVYIGRAGVVFITNEETGNKERFPKSSSEFANPFKVGKDGTREEVIEKYKNYITKKLEEDILLQEELLKMKSKHLGCWCAPEPCHGNILLELLSDTNFEGECVICCQKCNELSGWKCIKCNKCYCDEHNDNEFTCNC